MNKNFALKNLLDCVILTYKYDQEAFKRRVLDFVKTQQRRNTYYLMLSKEWRDFTNEDWDLSQKISNDILE
jgi:hypothetical protein